MTSTTDFRIAVLAVGMVVNPYPCTAQSDGPLFASIRKAGEVKVALGSAPRGK